MKTTARFATGPPPRLRLSRQLGNCFQRATAFTLAGFLLGVNQASALSTNLVVTTRHAPSLNGSGRIEGSLQQLLGESITLNGGFTLAGDLLVAGSPTLRLHGNPGFGGTLIGNGSESPADYQVTLNGNCAVYHLRTRTTPVALPTVSAPPRPAGTRTVTINNVGQSIGDPATLRHLTLNGNVGLVAVPPGTYGIFTANGGSGFILGTAGSTTPVVYHLQNLSLNGNCQLSVAGPVILTVANGVSASGSVGATNQSAWLQLQVASGGVTLNGGCSVYGSVTAPAGTVTVNGNSRLVGVAQCDRLVVNSGGLIEPGTTVNESPAATAQSLSVSEDVSLNVALTGSDPESGALTFSVLSQPAHGTLEGTVPNLVFVPSVDFNGNDGFTFKVNDGQADSASATISITVTPVNDAPVAQAQTQATPEDMPLEITLTGTDVDSESLLYEVATPPEHGSLTGTAPNVTYTPESDYFGGDHFKFSASDGQLTRTNTVTINVSPLDDRPSAIAQQVTADEDTVVGITLTGADAEGSQLAFFVATQPQHGTLVGIAPDLKYTPVTNYHGADNFQFTTSDGTLTSTVATVSLVINSINDPPTVQSQTVIVPEDVATNLVLAASDVEADSLQFELLSSPAAGTLDGTAPSLVFSPAADFHGTNTFHFSANDGQATSAPVAITLIVTPVNDPPVAAAQSFFLEEDSVQTITLGGADVDGDGLTFAVVIPPTNGILSGKSPNLTYTPIANFTGADSFTFETSDGQTHSTPATVTLTVLPVNDAPVAEDQSLTTEEDTALNLTLAGVDPENDALEFVVVTPPAHGTLTGSPPLLTYTPSANFHGMDAFTFFADDGQSNSAPATVAFTVNPVNDVPAAVPKSINTLEDTAVTIILSGSDLDGDVLAFQLVSGPTHGTLNGVAPSLTYQPLPDYSGLDAFTFSITDGQLNSSTGTVSIVVQHMNDAPLANAGVDQFTSVPTNTVALEGAVWDDDFFGTNSLVATWSQVAGPGIVLFAESTAPTMTATFGAPGVYTLRLTADDGLLTASDDVTVTINAGPVVSAGPDLRVTVGEIGVLPGTVSDDGLPSSNSVSVAWELVSATGFFTWNAPTNAVTTARFGEVGTYVLRLTASDTLATNSDEVTVTVLPVNLAPVVTAGPKQLIVLPAAANLTATVTDDGLPANVTGTFAWTKVGGPGVVDFANAATTNTTATFSEAGDYVLRFAANDSTLTAFSDVRIAVRTPAMNQAPVVSAGGDKVIGLTNIATLDGALSDDGLPQGAALTTAWSAVTGPGTVSFENASVTNARATFSVVGSYVLRLTVSDSQMTASDEVNVTVYPFNQPPLVDAGVDQSITIPDPAVLNSPTGTPTNVNVFLSQAHYSVEHWENAIGQPGLFGKAKGTELIWVGRNSLAADGTNIVAGGAFTNAGAILAKSLARFDGTDWHNFYDTNTIPGHPAETVDWLVYDCGSFEFCLETFEAVAQRGPEVFVAGSFQDLGNNDGSKDMTARWNGTNWVSWVFKNAGDQVMVIKATPELVYLGGHFAFQPTNATAQTITNLPWAYGVATWDGTNWGTLGAGITDVRDTPNPLRPGQNNYNAYTRCMAPGPNGDLYVGGSFFMQTATGIATNVAKWNGTHWEPLGSGLSGIPGNTSVMGMALAEDGNLYVGGFFTNAGGVRVGNVARWDGTHWWSLGEGWPNGVTGTVEAIATHGKEVYLGGSISDATGLSVSRIVKWNGQFWSRLGASTTNGVSGSVFSLAADGSGINVGGQFNLAGGLAATNIAQWKFPTPPDRIAHLAGQVTDDELPSGAALSAAWSKFSGPGTVTFANSNSPVTTASFGTTGTYLLRLTANDSEFTTLDEVSINVVGNRPPVVDAGPNVVNGVSEIVVLQGTVSDDGLPSGADVTWSWSVVNGPGTVTFGNRTETNSTARFSQTGTYVLRLTANDTHFSTFDDVTIVVSSDNQLPFGSPGSARTVAFGVVTNISPAVLRDDGLPMNATNVLWAQVSGPGIVSFGNPTNAATSLSFSLPGVYVIRLNVNDTELSAFLDVTFTVTLGNNTGPIVAAGPDLALTNLSGLLKGSVTDDGLPPGVPLSVYWTKSSGPGAVTFVDSNSPVTWVSFSKPGTYVLALNGSDSLITRNDSVVVTFPNQNPVANAGPDRTIVQPTMNLLLTGSASDDGQPNATPSATWLKASGPGTATFSPANAFTNTVTFSTAGTYVLRLTANDGSLTGTDELTVVVAPAGNQPPLVNAGADVVLSWPNTNLTLAGSISDDGLPAVATAVVAWSKFSGPGLVAFADATVPTTTVSFSQPGVYTLRLTGTDSLFTNGDDVVVQILPPINQPPVVGLPGGQTLIVTNPLALNGGATDDGLPFGSSLQTLWQKISGPGPVYFTEATNITTNLNTSARFILPGEYVLRLTASDSAVVTAADLVVTVLPADANQPPLVYAGPDLTGAQYNPLTLAGAVVDDGLPFGGVISVGWSKLSGPGNAYFSNAALSNSTVVFYLPGTYVLRLTASDGRTTAYDDVTITIALPFNEAPFAYAGANLEVVRPNAAVLEGAVFDDGLPAGYPLTYEWTKISGPGMVTFDAESGMPFGIYADTLARFSTNGEYVLRLTATDSQYTDYDEITVTVLPGTNTPPKVYAGADQIISLPQAVILQTDVTDDGLESGLLEIAWTQDSGPGPVFFSAVNGVYRASFTTAGDYVLRLTAHDGSLTNADTVAVIVYDTPAPIAEILTPADSAIITAPTAIIGTVSSAILQNYVVEYRLKPAEGAEAAFDWATLATGSTSVVSNTLAAFDPTLLLNGIYEIRLAATDLIGRSTTTEPVTIIVDRNLKIGHFTISFNDLTIPVAGLPLQVTRSYDSRAAAAGIQGDFGIGWTLDVKNVRLQKNRSLSLDWEQFTTGDPFDLSLAYHLDGGKPRIVAITFPDGRVEKFRFVPNPMDQALLPIGYPQWRFVPLGNTRGTLVPAGYDEPDGHFLAFDGSIPGVAELFDLNFFFDWLNGSGTEVELFRHPTLFRYTTPEGYRYLIDEIAGLQSVTDPNGNTLLVSTNSLTWSNPVAGTNSLSIAFQRDTEGRVTNIVDAAGHAMRYEYSTNGNLEMFLDRNGHANRFAYTNSQFAHYLTGITDGRGTNALENVYDQDGRLVATLDAFGNAVRFGNEFSLFRQAVTNRLGFVTVNEFDELGRLARKTDAVGLVTTYTYDANDNLITLSNAACACATRYSYDADGNLLTETDELGRTGIFTYSPRGKILTYSDLDGFTTTNSYDARGNLLMTRDPLGNVTTFTYTGLGQVATMTDPRGGVTQFQYDAQGRLTNEIDGRGYATRYTVDANGNLRSMTREQTLDFVAPAAASLFRPNEKVVPCILVLDSKRTNVVFTYTYDNGGHLVTAILPDGLAVTNNHDASDHIVSTTDQLGQTTTTDYNAAGRPLQITHPDGASERMTYDAEGQLTSHLDRANRETQFSYDPVGRMTSVTYSDGRMVSAKYDHRGWLTNETDACFGTSSYAYDEVGNRISATDALGRTTTYTYNAKRACTSVTDPLGRATRMHYDALNRNTNVLYPNGTSVFVGYAGRLVSAITNADGSTRQFRHDANGNLTRVTDSLGQASRFEYDSVGNLVLETDADGETVSHEYDTRHHRIRSVLPDGLVRSYSYDALGRMISLRDFDQQVTSFGYDARNNLVAITNALGQVTRYEYNTLGQRISQTDPNGQITHWSYDDVGRLILTEFPDGSRERRVYDSCGRVSTLEDQAGGMRSFTYDAVGRVSAISDPHQRWTRFGYDEAGNMISQLDAAGQTTSFSYDNMNRLEGMQLPDGSAVSQGYDARGRLAFKSDPLGHSRRFGYDANGRPNSITDPLGRTTAYDYDNRGNLVLVTDALGRTTGHEYDENNRLSRTTRADGSTLGFAYDSRGLLAVATNALGRLAQYGYDELGRLAGVTNALGNVTAYAHDALGRMTSRTDANGVITVFEYDALGRATNTVYADGTTESSAYDLAGRLVAATDARSNTTHFAYDIEGRLVEIVDALTNVTTFTYDALGRRDTMVDALGRTNLYTYDPVGRLLRTTYPDGSSVLNLYDAAGRRVAQVDEAGHTNYFGYDAANQLTSVTNALGHLTAYGYDELGSLISQTNANGQVTSYQYDALGRRVGRTLPGGASESFAYDPAGNLTNHVDFNARISAFAYDELDRPVQKTPDPFFAEPPVTWAYDPVGLRTNLTDTAGSTSYAYDNRYRLVRKTRAWNDSASESSLSYFYDAAGNVTGVTSSATNGVALAYAYDALDRLASVSDPHGGNTTYGYDPASYLSQITQPNGLHTTFQRDARNRVTQVDTRNAGGSPVGAYDYVLDATGRRVGAAERLVQNSLTNDLARTFTYDADYRLTSETITANSQTFALDYSYDPVGNRLARQSTLQSIPSISSSYDADDRLTSDSYDANGNTLAATVTDPFTALPATAADSYDHANRLVQRVTTLNSQPATIRFQYDGDGQRVAKSVGGATTHFLVDELNPTGWPQVLEEHSVPTAQPSTPAVTRVYAYGHSPLSQDHWNGTTWTASHFGQDAHGNVRYLTDQTGQVTDRYDYDAFGSLIAANGPTPNSRLFTGEEFDPDLGLYHLRARYHNPASGRFWTRDSFEGWLSDPASRHGYAYGRNDPVNRLDPSGHMVLSESLAVSSLAVTTRQMMSGMWAGMNYYGHGLGGGDSLKASNAVQALFIQGLSVHVGINLGRQNFFTTMQGAPFLLAQNPYTYRPPCKCFRYEVVGWDPDAPVYGASSRNAVFEFDFASDSTFRFAEGLVDLRGGARGIGRGARDLAVGAFELAENVVGAAAYNQLSQFAPETAQTLFGPQAAAFNQTAAGLGQLGWDAANGVAYNLIAPFDAGYAQEAYGGNLDRLEQTFTLATGGAEAGFLERLTYSATQVLLPGGAAKAGEAARARLLTRGGAAEVARLEVVAVSEANAQRFAVMEGRAAEGLAKSAPPSVEVVSVPKDVAAKAPCDAAASGKGGLNLAGDAEKTGTQLEFGFVRNLENPNFVLYKASEFNPSMLRPGEHTLNLPWLRNEALDWAQNQQALQRAMNIGNPIREANPNALGGWLQRERDFISSKGWQRTQQGSDVFWVKPSGQ